MPLFKGAANIGKNVTELKTDNEAKPADKKRPMKQIIAIALSVAKGKK